MTDDVDRLTDSPIADSASSSGTGAWEGQQGVGRLGGSARTCVQCSAGRIPDGPGDGDFAGDLGLVGPDFAGDGDCVAAFSGVLSAIMGGRDVGEGYSGVVGSAFHSRLSEQGGETAREGLGAGRTAEAVGVRSLAGETWK